MERIDEIKFFRKEIFFLGIKGSGMSSLAIFLKQKGHKVSGTDVSEVFYTDELLKRESIPFREDILTFKNLDSSFKLIIYSAAYKDHSILNLAQERGVEILSYPEALGELSKNFYSIAVTGSHGKTSTSFFSAFLLKALNLKPNVILGSSVLDFNNLPVLTANSDLFLAETCEYRRHFLNFSPQVIILTNVDFEHVDYFQSLEDVKDAFREFILKLGKGGILIYSKDDENLCEVVNSLERDDIKLYSYGFSKEADFIISDYSIDENFQYFSFLGIKDIPLKSPLRHNVSNFSASLLLSKLLLEREGIDFDFSNIARSCASSYKGVKRRLEFKGERAGVVFLDDYAHHPREISSTLTSLKEFYKERRLIVDFMSHTLSRTKTFLDDFVNALLIADVVILHDIYLSAREREESPLLMESFFKKLRLKNSETYYFKNSEDAIPFLKQFLKERDVFITMGAGNNFKIIDSIF